VVGVGQHHAKGGINLALQAEPGRPHHLLYVQHIRDRDIVGCGDSKGRTRPCVLVYTYVNTHTCLVCTFVLVRVHASLYECEHVRPCMQMCVHMCLHVCVA